MAAGPRDQLVTLQAYHALQDGYGQEQPSWHTLCDEWARVHYGAGAERRLAAAQQGQQTASFVMLANDVTRGLSVRDRILHGAGAWDIVSAVPIGRTEIEATAVLAS